MTTADIIIALVKARTPPPVNRLCPTKTMNRHINDKQVATVMAASDHITAASTDRSTVFTSRCQNAPPHLAHHFLDPHEFAPPPNGILIDSAISAVLSAHSCDNKHRDKPCDSTCSHAKPVCTLRVCNFWPWRRFALMPNAPFRLNTENFNCYWLMRAKIQHPPNWPLHICIVLPSVFWRCWLGGRKSIRPVKKLSGGV